MGQDIKYKIFKPPLTARHTKTCRRS